MYDIQTTGVNLALAFRDYSQRSSEYYSEKLAEIDNNKNVEIHELKKKMKFLNPWLVLTTFDLHVKHFNLNELEWLVVL